MSKEIIESGDTVKVNYTGKFENGEIFDSSIEEKAKNSENHNPQRIYEPLVVKIGAKQVIEGFEKALLGMKKSEEKEVTIPPEEGYGNFDSSLVQNIPMASFKSVNISPQIGQLLNTEAGICKVTKISPSDVEVDFNSPMAGKTLVFELKVEEIIKG
jgi:FKBP-type peptidyl-prolyl cis-trans isomerase 2